MPDLLVAEVSTATPTSSSTVVGETGGVVKRFYVGALSPFVNVKDPAYGAVGDGVTDDTAAIQAALSSGARKVLMPWSAKDYVVSAAIAVPSGVEFVGEGLPTIKLKNGSFGAGGSVISLTSVTGSAVRGIAINANRQNNTGNINGIYCYNSSQVAVEWCSVTNSSYGIRFTNGNTSRVTNNLVDGCLYYGISVKLAATTDAAYGYIISGNTCRNIASDATASADGQGIVVYGATGALAANYKNITNVVVSDNVCSACAAHGIALIAVSDYTVTGNNCFDCLQNTTFGSGICISEACRNGSVSGNACSGNYYAGILLDVVDQTGDRFSYGFMTVSNNTCDRNAVAGIVVQSMPHTTISGNACSHSVWGILLVKGGFNNIVGNTISYCTNNAIRAAGIVGATGDDQSHILIADNILDHCTTPAGDQYSALFLDYFSTVKVRGNDCYANTQDLTVQATCANVELVDNRFTGNIYIDTSDSIKRWVDGWRTTAAGKSFLSTEFANDGIVYFKLAAGFTLPHFGLEWCPVYAAGAVTSSLVTAIATGGFVGQKLRIVNYDAPTITIKHDAGTKNIGSADVVLAYGEVVEYVWRGSQWTQIAAKVATSI